MKLYLDFNPYAKKRTPNWEDFSSALLDDSFTRKSCFGAKGKSEIQTVQLQLKPVVGIDALAVRILTATNDIRAKITWDNGTPYFIGTIRPMASVKVDAIVNPISIEILDDTYFLDYYMVDQASTLDVTGMKVVGATTADSLVHWLINLAKVQHTIENWVPAFSSSEIIIDDDLADDQIPVDGITVEIGDYVNDILEAVCYEFNLQYRCDEQGRIHIARALPESITGARVLQDTDIKNQLTIKRGDDAKSGVVVQYYPVQSGTLSVAEHSAFDTRYADDKTFGRGYEWLNPDEPGGMWPPLVYQQEALSGVDLDKPSKKILRYDISSMKTEILFHDKSKDTSQARGRHQLVSSADGKYMYRFWIAPTKRKTLVKRIRLVCKCWYIDTSDIRTTLVEPGSNPEEHDAKYVRDRYNAERLMQALKLRSRSGLVDYSFEASPEIGLVPGEIVQLSSGTSGMAPYVRVLAVTDHGDSKSAPLVEVICEGVQALGDIEVDTTEQVRSILSREGVEMLKLTPSQNPSKYNKNEGLLTVTASGAAVDQLGGSLKWYKDDEYYDGLDGALEVVLSHAFLGAGQHVIKAEVEIPGIDFGDKPLDAEVTIIIVMDGEKGDKGDKGDRGLQGLQGEKGDQGIPGDDGSDGLTAYSHIAYADNASGGGFSQSPTGKTYVGFYADHTEADSTNPSDYHWSLIKGADGAQGIQGPKGADGSTAYFHTAWANNETGTSGFSTTVSSGKLYIGTYSDFTAADSTDPSKYKWVKIKGETGETGAQGPQGNTGASGASGVTTAVVYLYRRGATAPTKPTANCTYTFATGALTGITQSWTQAVPATNGQPLWVIQATASATAPTATATIPTGSWGTQIKLVEDGAKGDTGTQGPQGIQGPQGVQGPSGADGASLYTWVAYADNASGAGISTSPTGKTYVGFAYNKTTPTISLTPGLFTWAKIEGPQGTTGATGATLYTWLKYADTPTSGMSDSPTGKTYMGLAYNKSTPTESTAYGDYTWSLIKGETGATGAQGATGLAGLNQATLYLYQRKASAPAVTDIADPITYTFATGAISGTLGAWSRTVPAGTNPLYVTTAVAISNTATDTIPRSEWSAPVKMAENGVKGDQGPQGVQGPSGSDGQSLYTWVAYANDADGNGISASSTNKPYVGFAYNKTTPTMTLTPSLFTWARIEGPQGVQGATGSTGAQGVAGLNQATIHLYQRKSTQPAVTDIASSLTYTFSSGALSGTLGSWTTAVPTGTDPLWVTIAVAIGNGTTDTIARSEWTTPARMAQDGATGAQGATGSAGASGVTTAVVYLYRRGASAPAKPSTASTYTFATGALTGHNNSWTQAVPATDGNPLWVIQATASATAPTATASIPAASWGTPIKMVLDGATGATGATLYTWLKYADSPTSGMSDLPDGKPYIGLAYNKTTPVESTAYADYQWTRIKGDPGTPARDFEITATPSIYELSARGVILKDETIMLQCRLLNIPAGATISWELLDAEYDLGAITGEQSSIFLTEGYAPPLITVQCTVAGYGSKTLTVAAVRLGEPKPYYLGVLEDAPPDVNGQEPIIDGDYYLDMSNIPRIYRGGSWFPVTSTDAGYSQIVANCLADALSSGRTVGSMSALYGYFQSLVARSLIVSDEDQDFIFSVTPDGYITSSGRRRPAFDISVPNPIPGNPNNRKSLLHINAADKKLMIDTDGVFSGVIDSPALTTAKGSEARNKTFAPSEASVYPISTLYDSVSVVTDVTPQDMTDSYYKKPIAKAGRLSAGGMMLTLGTWSADRGKQGSGWVNYANTIVPNGCNFINVTLTIYNDWGIGTPGGANIEIWRGGSRIANTTYRGSFSSTKSASYTYDVQPGDTIKAYVEGYPITGTSHAYTDVTYRAKATEKSLFFLYSDGSHEYVPYNGYTNIEAKVGEYTSVKTLYVAGDMRSLLLEDFAADIWIPCLSGSDYSTKVLGASLATASVVSMKITSESIQFMDAGGNISTISVWDGGIKSATGLYESLSATLVTEATPRRIDVSTLTPKAGASVGAEGEPFNFGYFLSLITQSLELAGKINNLTITKPASGSTLTIADGKTLSVTESAALDQNLRTTDAVTFATVNTGYGASEVYPVTYQAITVNAANVALSAMASGEIKFVAATFTGHSKNEYRLNLPSGGSYVVLSSNNSTLDFGNYLIAAPLAGGNTIGMNSTSTSFGHFIIRRLP